MDALQSDRPEVTAMGFDDLDAAIDRAISENRVVGCVVLVAQDGEIVYRRASGYADREAGRAMQVETPFRFSSVTKPFTTMAALKLIEQGQLSPDDSVTKYLPDFRPRLADGTEAEITIGHLMTHTAGFDYRFQQPHGGLYEKAGVSDGLDESDGTLGDNLARLASVPLMAAPGTEWRYSVATDVLGAVISAVAGKSLDLAIRDLVTDPLGLDAAFHWQADELAVPYRDAPGRPVRIEGVTEVPLPFTDGPGIRFDPGRITRKTAWPSGGGGMAGRASDVLTLLETYRAGDFLPPSLREAARQPRVAVSEEAMGPGMAFSWIGSVVKDPAAAGSGWSEGSVSWGGVYGHWWCIDFRRRRTVVSLTNTALEGLFGQYVQDVSKAAAAA